MPKQKNLLRIGPIVVLVAVLPCCVDAMRRPLRTLAETTKGDGTKYTSADEGQLFSGRVRNIRQGQGRGDTGEIWLTEVPDETSYVYGPEGEQLVTRNVNLVVEASVTFDSIEGEYEYGYTLYNPRSSPRGAQDFEIAFDPGLPFSSFQAPQARPYHWSAWARRKDTNPESWRRDGRPTRWSGEMSVAESLDGFSFRSLVLPGVCHCWSRVIIFDVESFFLGGNTVGPVAPPDTFDVGKFLERLKNIIDMSLTEGWIESEKVAQDLREKLELAQKAVNNEDLAELKSTLEQMLREIEGQRNRSLLSESFGLLKYNIQYWLNQLE